MNSEIKANRTGIAKAVVNGSQGMKSAHHKRTAISPGPSEAVARYQMKHAMCQSEQAEHVQRIHDIAADFVCKARGDGDARIAGTAAGVVRGAIEASDMIDLDAQTAAEAAATGALEAAGEAGKGATEHVTKIVTGAIWNIEPLDRTLFSSGRRAP